MTDEELADLLGAAPASPDPAFRYDVFARVIVHDRRNAARRRAVHIVAASTALGLFCGLAQAAGFTAHTALPLIYAAAAAGMTYALAVQARKSTALIRALGRFRFRL